MAKREQKWHTELNTQFSITFWERARKLCASINFENPLTLPVRGSRFCGCEGGGLPKPPPRNQWWNDMRYYVAIDKMFIDRFRDHMQKFWKKSQKLAELWIFEKFPRSAPKNCRHTKMHAIRPKLNIFSSSFLQTSPFHLYYWIQE